MIAEKPLSIIPHKTWNGFDISSDLLLWDGNWFEPSWLYLIVSDRRRVVICTCFGIAEFWYLIRRVSHVPTFRLELIICMSMHEISFGFFLDSGLHGYIAQIGMNQFRPNQDLPYVMGRIIQLFIRKYGKNHVTAGIRTLGVGFQNKFLYQDLVVKSALYLIYINLDSSGMNWFWFSTAGFLHFLTSDSIR